MLLRKIPKHFVGMTFGINSRQNLFSENEIVVLVIGTLDWNRNLIVECPYAKY